MDNRNFWNERYKSLPELGSGPGSRGAGALRKQKLFRTLAELNAVNKIVDIGCGDVSWYETGLLDGVDYLGIDISDVIVKKNSEKYPELSFIHFDLSESIPSGVEADVCVCFDVLLHQCDEKKFTNMLNHILAMTKNHALISYPTDNESQGEVINTIQTDEEQSLDNEFMSVLERLDKDRPRGNVKIFNDLVGRIKHLDSNILVRRVGQYRTHPLEDKSHTIYELSRSGQWLMLGNKVF